MNNSNIVDKQIEALNNSLNYHNLTGFKIHEYWQQDKRVKKKLYFLTDGKGNSLTGHWESSEINHFILGYGKAINKLIEQNNILLEALKETAQFLDSMGDSLNEAILSEKANEIEKLIKNIKQ